MAPTWASPGLFFLQPRQVSIPERSEALYATRIAGRVYDVWVPKTPISIHNTFKYLRSATQKVMFPLFNQ